MRITEKTLSWLSKQQGPHLSRACGVMGICEEGLQTAPPLIGWGRPCDLPRGRAHYTTRPGYSLWIECLILFQAIPAIESCSLPWKTSFSCTDSPIVVSLWFGLLTLRMMRDQIRDFLFSLTLSIKNLQYKKYIYFILFGRDLREHGVAKSSLKLTFIICHYKLTQKRQASHQRSALTAMSVIWGL